MLVWKRFNPQKEYPNGIYEIAYDGLVMDKARHLNGRWMRIEDKTAISKKSIFYIRQSQRVLSVSHTYWKTRPVQYNY